MKKSVNGRNKIKIKKDKVFVSNLSKQVPPMRNIMFHPYLCTYYTVLKKKSQSKTTGKVKKMNNWKRIKRILLIVGILIVAVYFIYVGFNIK